MRCSLPHSHTYISWQPCVCSGDMGAPRADTGSSTSGGTIAARWGICQGCEPQQCIDSVPLQLWSEAINKGKAVYGHFDWKILIF